MRKEEEDNRKKELEVLAVSFLDSRLKSVSITVDTTNSVERKRSKLSSAAEKSVKRRNAVVSKKPKLRKKSGRIAPHVRSSSDLSV